MPESEMSVLASKSIELMHYDVPVRDGRYAMRRSELPELESERTATTVAVVLAAMMPTVQYDVAM